MSPKLLFLYLVFITYVGLSQPAIEFKEKSRLPSTAFQSAMVYDGENLYMPEANTLVYWMYSIKQAIWEKLKLPLKGLRKVRPIHTVRYLPAYRSLIALNNPLEIIDTKVLKANLIEVEGAVPANMGVDIRQNKLYIFGGGVWQKEQAKPPELVLSDPVRNALP